MLTFINKPHLNLTMILPRIILQYNNDIIPVVVLHEESPILIIFNLPAILVAFPTTKTGNFFQQSISLKSEMKTNYYSI